MRAVRPVDVAIHMYYVGQKQGGGQLKQQQQKRKHTIYWAIVAKNSKEATLRL